jgi:hypothetical protein
MRPEITPAATLLLAFLVALFAHDVVERRRQRRMLLVQLAVFIGGGALILYPDVATRLAHVVGIGRGVDFVIYPLVIWLVRESLLSRRRRREDEERLTELVRSLAIDRARSVARDRPS